LVNNYNKDLLKLKLFLLTISTCCIEVYHIITKCMLCINRLDHRNESDQ